MNNIDEFTLKKIVLYLDNKSLELKIVGPKNNIELNELKELDKKERVKFQIIDASSSFISHKGILQKILNDLSGQKSFSEIVDRNLKSPSLLQICASNVWLRKTALSLEEFEKKVHEENLTLDNYKKLKK